MESVKESHCSTEHSTGKLLRFIKNSQKLQNFLLLKGTMCAAIQVWNVLRNIIYLRHQIALLVHPPN